MRIALKSLPPKEYNLLPALDAPASYICVLRDIDRDAYRIDFARHPATYVDELLAESRGIHGIELISILETDDLTASERQLFDAHHARLSKEWIQLDSHQLAELRRSELQISAHRSFYLAPQSATPAKSAGRSVARYDPPAARYLRDSATQARRRRSRAMLAYREEAANSQPRPARLEDISDAYSALLYLGERLNPLRELLYRWREFVLDYMLLILFVLFALTIALLAIMALSLSQGGFVGYWR